MTTTNTEEFEIFPWNDNFNTGIKQIDEQHQVIVSLLNKLANHLTQDEELEIENTFNELAKYADFHFKCEEAIWKNHITNKELIDSHEHSHNSFLPEVLAIKENNQDKSYTEVIEEILLFLIRWLAFHIVDEDKRLALIIESLNSGKELSEAMYVTDDIMSNAMRELITTVLTMYDSLSLKTINLLRERKARIRAEKELQGINKKLEELAITDQLTQLYNRRHFDDMFEREIKKSQRNKSVISILLIDIDYFKKINDTYGHLYGDKVLCNVANCLKAVFKRPNDCVFRVGGEEFTVLITNENLDCVLSIIQILQQSIAELNIENKGSLVSEFLTISGGLVSKIPSQDDTMDSLMKQADEKLYDAKASGRNKVIQ